MAFQLAVCFPVPDEPPDLPTIEIPFLGELKKAAGSLYAIPDPTELLNGLLDQVNVALAPVRQLLEIIEVLMAIKSCFDAIVDAIKTLSPGPIFDCFGALFEALARLLAYIPPFKYIAVLLGVLDLVIQIIDAILDVFLAIDQKITEFKAALDISKEYEDDELEALGNCAMLEIKAPIAASIDILRIIRPVVFVLSEAIVRFVPDPQLQADLDKLQEALAKLESIRDAIVNGASIPALEELLGMMNIIRSALVSVYNILAPIIGKPANKVIKSLPIYENF